MSATIRLPAARRLPETARILRRLGIRLSPQAALTIAPAEKRFDVLPNVVGTIPPLLVPESISPARTLALLRKLGTSSPGPFFAAGKAGQINAALFAAACLATRNPKTRRALDRFRTRQTSSVPSQP